jgi:hypothetical protein
VVPAGAINSGRTRLAMEKPLATSTSSNVIKAAMRMVAGCTFCNVKFLVATTGRALEHRRD